MVVDLKSRRNFFKVAILSIFFSVFVFYVLTVFWRFRPVQDDYVTLNQLSIDGFFAPSLDVWNNLGGNLSTVLVRSILLWDSRYSVNFIGLRLFPVLTFFVVLVGVRSLVALCEQRISRSSIGISSLILVIGMEGIFTPGILGILNFSAASLVHFWPICLLPSIVYLLSCVSVPRNLFGYFILLFTSNANITEAVLYVTVFLYLFLNCRGKSSKWLFGLAISSANVVLILIAPGFGRRRSLFSQDLDLWHLPILFFKNLAIFSVDLLTHPVIYLLFISGFSLSSMFRFRMKETHFLRVLLLMSMYLLLTALGSSFAYPAWHQNLGLIPIVSLLSIQLGIRMRGKLPKLDSKIVLFLCTVVAFFMLSRVSLEVTNRAAAWDFNLNLLAQEYQLVKFQAAEITYPPFELGIEDVATWGWMADPYLDWVRNFGARNLN